MKKNEAGMRRTFWLPNKLDAKVEKARESLGLGRSGFYRYAVVKLLEALISRKNTGTEGSNNE